MAPINHQTGRHAEQLACEYLEQQGLELICRNYHAPGGEIDLIMRDGSQLVFVEVRYRSKSYFGSAAESVDFKKQQRIRHTALCYLQQTDPDCSARFDVVAIDKGQAGKGLENNINWITNAF